MLPAGPIADNKNAVCKDVYDFEASDEDKKALHKDDNSHDKPADDEPMEVIVQATSNTKTEDGKRIRKWNKVNACNFCDYRGTGHLDLHLEAHHSDENDVKELLKYKKVKGKALVTDLKKKRTKKGNSQGQRYWKR